MQGKTIDGGVHLRNMLNPTGAAERQADDDAGLPTLKDGEYQPHARPGNKPLFALHVVSPGGEIRTFQYVHLDSGSQFAVDRMLLTFMGMEPVRVVIEGRNLWLLYDYIHQHRIAWVAVCGRDFAENGETIITRVSYVPVRGEAE